MRGVALFTMYLNLWSIYRGGEMGDGGPECRGRKSRVMYVCMYVCMYVYMHAAGGIHNVWNGIR